MRERGSRQQVSRGRPVATPCLTSCAFKFRPAPFRLQSPPHSRNHNKNKTKGDGAGPVRAPRGEANCDPPPVTSPALSQPAPDPCGGQHCHRPAPRPLPPGRRRPGLELRLASGAPRPPPPPIPKMPPHLFKYAEEEFPIKLCQAVTSPPSQPTLSGQSAGEITLHLG